MACLCRVTQPDAHPAQASHAATGRNVVSFWHLGIAWIEVLENNQGFRRAVIGNGHTACGSVRSHKKFVLGHLVETN